MKKQNYHYFELLTQQRLTVKSKGGGWKGAKKRIRTRKFNEEKF